MDVSVVIPCFKSRATLPALIERLAHVLPDVASAFEVILVVDGSPDDTYAVAHELERRYPQWVRAMLLRRNYGQHNAILAGLSRARFEITVTMDDDLQHLPEAVPQLLGPLRDPLVDLVYGVPAKEEHGWIRSVASRAVKNALALASVPNAREVSAFRAFRTELRDGIAHVDDPHASIDVLLSWCTTAVDSVPVEMEARRDGRSGYRARDLWRHAMNMVTGYGVLPLRAVSWLGIGVASLGFALLAVVLARYLAGSIEVAGFTTLASMLAILSGTLMLSIGILGEYVGRLHFRSMQKPMYVVRTGCDVAVDAGTHSNDVRGMLRNPRAEVADALKQRYLDRTASNGGEG